MEKLTQILLIIMIISFIATCMYVTYFLGWANGWTDAVDYNFLINTTLKGGAFN